MAMNTAIRGWRSWLGLAAAGVLAAISSAAPAAETGVAAFAPGGGSFAQRIVFSKPLRYDRWQEPETASLYVWGHGFERRLTRAGAGRIDGSASWSPDGKRISFTRTGGKDGSQVRVVDWTGRNDRLIGKGRDPVWSPYQRDQMAFIEGSNAYNCLTVLNPDGTGKRRLSCLKVRAEGGESPHRFWARYVQPRWSADGRFIYVTRHRWMTGGGDPNNDYDIRRIDADTGEVMDLTADRSDGLYSLPQPARDGAWVAYCDCLLAEPDYYTNRVGRFDLRTRTPKVLADGRNPLVSRDDKTIAFVDALGRLATVAVQGGRPRVLGDDVQASYVPVAWYPGDRALLVNKSRYVTVPGATYDRLIWELVRVDVRTGRERPLTLGQVHPGAMY